MDEFLKLFPRPTSPVRVPTESDWSDVEHSLGVRFPADYRQLLNEYGEGSFRLPSDTVVVVGPQDLAEEVGPDGLYTDQLETWFEDFEPDEIPYPAFPEPGGLLGFGGNDNGYSFFWKTEGPSDAWTIVAATEDGDMEEYELSLTDFLARMSRGQLDTTQLNQAINRDSEGELRFVPRSN